jgi:hypothetical protein
MVQYTAMSTTARAQVISSIKSDDPAVTARQHHIFELFSAQHPEWSAELRKKEREAGLEEGLKKGLEEGEIIKARGALRLVLARRGLVLSAEEDARIDACKNVATLDRWLAEATVASSTAEALGPLRGT